MFTEPIETTLNRYRNANITAQPYRKSPLRLLGSNVLNLAKKYRINPTPQECVFTIGGMNASYCKETGDVIMVGLENTLPSEEVISIVKNMVRRNHYEVLVNIATYQGAPNISVFLTKCFTDEPKVAVNQNGFNYEIKDDDLWDL